MDALYKTTVGELVANTETRIIELKTQLAEKRERTYQLAMQCKDYEQVRALIEYHRERDILSGLGQYTENLEYLKACDGSREVMLNQTEWRHYFHGAPRPELR